MTTTKKLLTVALAATALAVGALGATGEASAKGWKGGWKGGHHFKWHGHRWHGRHYFTKFYGYYDYAPCYFVKKKFGKVIKICPDYY